MVDDDDRFDKFKKDPRFKSIKNKKGTRVKVDGRFKAMFQKSSQFNQHLIRDRYGKKKNLAKKEKAQILRFYENEENEEKEYDRARGIGVSESSESEPDSESDQSEDEEVTANQEATYEEPTRSDDVFKRLAMTNMDWDRLNSKDIFVLANSAVQSGGRLERVTIYVSNFGQTRIEDEKVNGPKMDYSIADPEERKKVHQLERLKYFYAVCETDSIETADTIYKELDGQEYGETGVRVDLRFIPDEIEFDEEIRQDGDRDDITTQAPVNYTPPDFVTSALTRSKVDLTWDETPKRRETLLKKMDRKKMVDSSDMVQHLIASGSDSDDDDPDAAEKRAETKRKFAELLGHSKAPQGANDFFEEKEEDDVENSDEEEKEEVDGNVEFKMEAPKSDDSDDLISDDENEKPKKKKRKEEEKEIVEKESDKRQREELELLFSSSDEESNQKHFDIREEERERRLEAKKERKRKWKSKMKTQASDGVDLSDNRFSTKLLSHPDFSIDRTHPQYKYNKAVDEIAKRKTTRVERSGANSKEANDFMSNTSDKKKEKKVPRDLIARLKLKAKK